MIVLDSSAIVEWLLGLPKADAVGARILAADSLHAPSLMDIEVAQVMRRYAAAGEIAADTGERALNVLRDLDVNRYTHESLLTAVWKLRHNLTAYDAAFVALAGVLDAPLITLDRRISGAVLPGWNITVDVVE